ncbi:MAG: hypothetical protein GY830_08155 [Bacteroidetes bacterium]|nr:hypothetical protein [Bacteroidota bacterium]
MNNQIKYLKMNNQIKYLKVVLILNLLISCSEPDDVLFKNNNHNETNHNETNLIDDILQIDPDFDQTKIKGANPEQLKKEKQDLEKQKNDKINNFIKKFPDQKANYKEFKKRNLQELNTLFNNIEQNRKQQLLDILVSKYGVNRKEHKNDSYDELKNLIYLKSKENAITNPKEDKDPKESEDHGIPLSDEAKGSIRKILEINKDYEESSLMKKNTQELKNILDKEEIIEKIININKTYKRVNLIKKSLKELKKIFDEENIKNKKTQLINKIQLKCHNNYGNRNKYGNSKQLHSKSLKELQEIIKKEEEIERQKLIEGILKKDNINYSKESLKNLHIAELKGIKAEIKEKDKLIDKILEDYDIEEKREDLKKMKLDELEKIDKEQDNIKKAPLIQKLLDNKYYNFTNEEYLKQHSWKEIERVTKVITDERNKYINDIKSHTNSFDSEIESYTKKELINILNSILEEKITGTEEEETQMIRYAAFLHDFETAFSNDIKFKNKIWEEEIPKVIEPINDIDKLEINKDFLKWVPEKSSVDYEKYNTAEENINKSILEMLKNYIKLLKLNGESERNLIYIDDNGPRNRTIPIADEFKFYQNVSHDPNSMGSGITYIISQILKYASKNRRIDNENERKKLRARFNKIITKINEMLGLALLLDEDEDQDQRIAMTDEIAIQISVFPPIIHHCHARGTAGLSRMELIQGSNVESNVFTSKLNNLFIQFKDKVVSNIVQFMHNKYKENKQFWNLDLNNNKFDYSHFFARAINTVKDEIKITGQDNIILDGNKYRYGGTVAPNGTETKLKDKDIRTFFQGQLKEQYTLKTCTKYFEIRLDPNYKGHDKISLTDFKDWLARKLLFKETAESYTDDNGKIKKEYIYSTLVILGIANSK